jgi:hypothetical protein
MMRTFFRVALRHGDARDVMNAGAMDHGLPIPGLDKVQYGRTWECHARLYGRHSTNI